MRRPTMVVMMVVVGATAAGVYLPTLGAEFVYDDIAQVKLEDYIHKPAHLWEVLSLRVLGRDIVDHNRPVMLLSLMVDSMLWGRNPVGYHLTSLLLHVACSVLLFLLLWRIFRRLAGPTGGPASPLLGALAGAILFAVHPVGSEAVCVVSFREDLLVALFVLVMLSLAERFPTERRGRTVLLGGGCVLSMLAAVAVKESGAAAPAILLMYWLIVRRRIQWRAWVGLITAGLVVTVAFLAARFAVEPEQSVIFATKPKYLGGSFSEMLRIQPQIWAFQLSQVFWPDRLCADYNAYSVRHISLTLALAGLAIAALVTVLLARRNSGVGFGAAFYWLALLPVSNLVPIYRPLADRYLYLPMVGVCLAVGAIVRRWKITSRRRAVALAAGAVVICSVLGVVTVRRTFVWQTRISLWEDATGKNPYSLTAYDNLGFARFDEGELDKAAQAFKRACRLAPGEAKPWAGLAITYEAMGKPDLAEQALRKAFDRDQRYADPACLVEPLLWSPEEAEKLQVVADRIFKR